jgi:type 1 glutamine amidotransferase
VLIFSRCGEGGDVHESILVSEKALVILGEKTRAYSADVSYDYGVFDAARLAPYDALILNNNADIPFPQDAPRQALIDFVRNGKGIVGIHGAAENFNDFPEARKMMGVQFAGHPGPRQGQRR